MFLQKMHQCFLQVLLMVMLSFSNGRLIDSSVKPLNLLPKYDYIIVGAGPAGLVIANRLSENPNVTVLILEAGQMDSREASVTLPSDIGVNVGSRYDWNITTVKQDYLGNQTRSLSQGRALGGGTILNGMIWTRGTQSDFDAWRDLGNDGWGWDDMAPYFEKVESFTDKSHVLMSLGTSQNISSSPVYGSGGPVQVAYPEYFYDQFNNFIDANRELGVELIQYLSSGSNVGVVAPPFTLSPSNQSRFDARTAYLTDALNRVNLHILPETMATRVVFQNQTNTDTEVVVKGIEYLNSHNVAFSGSIDVVKEVIMAAGAIWTPTLLQVSGVGPSTALNPLGISTIINLPGVGANLQDHAMITPSYQYQKPHLSTAQNLNATVLRNAEETYFENRTGPLTAPLIEAISYLSLADLTDLWQSALSILSYYNFSHYLPLEYTDELIRGYGAQHDFVVKSLNSSSEGALEVMADSLGTLQIALQRPFTRGSVRPKSSDILDGVAVDPRYGSHPFDLGILVMGLRWNKKLVNTPALQDLFPAPEAALLSDDGAELERLVKSQMGTGFHPCGTAAMMPRKYGGVVDNELKVYGVQNLRVADSSVIPLIPSAHLQAVVYALAEKASNIIKGQ